MKALLATACLAAFGLLSNTAAAETINFCIQHTGAYEDNGEAGEDYWTDDGAKLARGAFFEVYEGANQLFAWYLGDGLGVGDPGIGCTGNINVPTAAGTYDLTVSSYGKVNGNDVKAYDDEGSLWAASSTYTWVGGSGSRTLTISVGAGLGYMVLNVYQAGAYAMYRHNGGLSSQLFDYRVGPSLGTGYSRALDQIQISGNPTDGSGRWDEKFPIIHEAGHRMADLGTQAVMNSAQDYGIADATCPGEPTGQSHSMRSEEYSGAAAGEGFSHFYAADVFNSDDETDCWFEYYKQVGSDFDPAVNCETGNGSFTLARLETDCGGTNDRGTELDWLRTYWDVHTDGAAPDPTFTSIVSWLDTATAWSRTTAYDELDAEANDVGGELNTNWDTTKITNGVDH